MADIKMTTDEHKRLVSVSGDGATDLEGRRETAVDGADVDDGAAATETLIGTAVEDATHAQLLQRRRALHARLYVDPDVRLETIDRSMTSPVLALHGPPSVCRRNK